MSNEIIRADGEIVHTGALLPLVTIDQMVSRHKTIQECATRIMKEGQDFGVIPGTERKDGTKNLVLLKPGAEKLCTLFGLTPDFQEDKVIVDFEKGLFFFSYRCVLLRGAAQEMNAAGRVVTIGQIVGTGIGSANSREKKYTRVTRTCPACGAACIKRSRYAPRDQPDAEPGWYCHGKDGGCGANFGFDDPAITEQAGAVDVNAAAELVNTLQKMAQKRAMIASVLVATNASDLFTQDFGEEESLHRLEQQERQPAKQQPPKPANGGPPKTGNELLERLQLFERKLVDAGLCDLGKLIAHVLAWGGKRGEKGLIADWTGAVLGAAVEEAKGFKRYRQIQKEVSRLRLQPADVDDLCNRNKVASLDVLARSEALSKISLDYLGGIKTPEPPKGRPRSATDRQIEELELEAERLCYTDAEILDTIQPYKAQTWADLTEPEATELLAELRDAQPAAS